MFLACCSKSDTNDNPNDNPPGNLPVAVQSVSFDKPSLRLKIGDTQTLTATVLPDNATDKTLVWKSDNTGVATVLNGKIIAAGAGECQITASAANSIKATCNITVEPASESDIDIYSVGGLSSKIGSPTTEYIWKNGEVLYSISIPDNTLYFSGLAVSNGNVYTSGRATSSAAMISFATKNGANYFQYPTQSGFMNPSNMILVGEDMYTVGYDYDASYTSIGHLWKNDAISHTFLSPYTDAADVFPTAVIRRDDSFYTAASAYQYINETSLERPLIYKDEQVHLSLAYNGTEAKVSSLCEYNGDLYSCGKYSLDVDGNVWVACVWKNKDILYTLSSGVSGSWAKAIAVAPNGDLYVGGIELGSGDNMTGIIWKNGEVLYRLVSQEYPSSALSDMALANGKCYAVGAAKVTDTGIQHAALWCDGELTYDLYDTGSATPYGDMSRIYIQRK